LSSPDAAAAAVNAWPSYSSSSSFNADNFDSKLALHSPHLYLNNRFNFLIKKKPTFLIHFYFIFPLTSPTFFLPL
jgi:hypothetical protein